MTVLAQSIVAEIVAQNIIENEFFPDLDAWEDFLNDTFALGTTLAQVRTGLDIAYERRPDMVDRDTLNSLRLEAVCVFDEMTD